MKKYCWLTLGLMVATAAVAQDNTNSLPPIPAPVTSPAAESTPTPAATTATVPAPKAAPVRRVRRVAAPARAARLKEPTVTLVPGLAEVAVGNLTVRGQAGLRGEQVTHLSKGDTVTVLNQINLDKHAPGEPAQWAKIALPANVHVWVFAKYVDEASKEVSARKLNLRSGPGENYSVLGVIEKGAPINELETKGEWIRIEAPTNAYAFVAAMYLKQEAPVPTAITSVAPAETTPTPTPVPEAQPIVTQPTNPPPVETPTPIVTATPEAVATAAEANVPPPPRIATHEGVVRHVGSLITPTAYELYDPTTDKNVDFLYSPTTYLDLSRYVNMRIIVTGEEGMAARWPDIPVLTVQRILVIKTNAVPKVIYRSPRQSQPN